MIRVLCALGLVLVGCSNEPCDGKPDVCINATIANHVGKIDQLVFVTDQPRPEVVSFPTQAATALSFPLQLALQFPLETQLVSILVQGLAAGEQLANASATVAIPQSGHAGITLTLEAAPDAGFDLGAPLDLMGRDLFGVDLTDGDFDVDQATPPPAFQVQTLTGLGALSLLAGDFDKNGTIDLAWVGGPAPQVGGIAVNDGTGSFSLKTTFNQPSGGPSSLAVIDLNKDGKLDLFALSTSGGAFYLGNGDATLGSAVPFSITNGRIAGGADLDGDGTGDVAITSYGSSSLQVYSSVSSPLSDDGGAYTAAAGAEYLAFGDINKDNHPDVVIAAYDGTTERIATLLHSSTNGEGSLFQNAVTFTPSAAATAVALADLDNDGDLDLLLCLNNGLAVSAGNGDGTWGAVMNLNFDLCGDFIATGDFDGDGKLDIVYTMPLDNKVLIWRNLGALTFASWHTYRTGAAPENIVVADFDGDTKPDIATGNWNDGTITILLNRSH